MLMVSKFIWLSLFSKVSVFFFKWTKSFSWAQLFLLTGFTSKMIQVCVIFNGHAACQNFQKLQQQVSPSKLGTRGCLFSSDSLSLSQKKQQISTPTLGTRGFSSDSLVVDDATFETHTEQKSQNKYYSQFHHQHCVHVFTRLSWGWCNFWNTHSG